MERENNYVKIFSFTSEFEDSRIEIELLVSDFTGPASLRPEGDTARVIYRSIEIEDGEEIEPVVEINAFETFSEAKKRYKELVSEAFNERDE